MNATFAIMTGIDIILGGLLAYGLIKGFWKGLFVELASLISLIAGVFVAVKFSQLTASILEGTLSDDPATAGVIAFAITFLAVVISIALLAKVFTKLADYSGLGLMNRVLGGVFGFMRMALVVSVLLNFFLKLNFDHELVKKETLSGSFFFYPLVEVSAYIFPVFEDWFRE
ncbi:CvpA family protein [uncultured Flavobacterium sp.]|uniref:CvpA family protein n=1 Tax=uncultured Flavobacterium sp. TaxID=165435 RepID=UPI0025DA5B79|nr:CvpA family protein [uncultured Flavobacterium sp.]